MKKRIKLWMQRASRDEHEAPDDLAIQSPGLFNKLQNAIQQAHLGRRTAEVYRHWIKRYLAFYKLTDPRHLTTDNVKQFLQHLVDNLHLSRARQMQALNAIIFLYDQVLGKPLVTLKELADSWQHQNDAAQPR